jgi:hypothetical protein
MFYPCHHSWYNHFSNIRWRVWIMKNPPRNIIHSFVTSSLTVPYLRRLVAGFPPRQPGFDPSSSHVGFVVALGQVFLEYFCFPSQFSFHRLLHTHDLSSGAGTKGQLVADVPSGLSPTPPQETKKNSTSSLVSTLFPTRSNCIFPFAYSHKTVGKIVVFVF